MNIAEIFKHLLARRTLPPRPEGPLPDKDDPEMETTTGERLVGGETLVLYYTDSNGVDSVRRITINKVDETFIHAWCHERLGNRMFRIRGIRSLATLDGELYDNLDEMLPVTALDHLGQLEPDMWPEGGESQFWHVSDPHERRFYALREQVKGEIVLLRAVARSDGIAIEAEDQAIYDYLKSRIKRDDYQIGPHEKTLALRWIKSLFPEPFEIDAAVPSLVEISANRVGDFLTAGKKIIMADGKVTDEELALYERLGKEILAERKRLNG